MKAYRDEQTGRWHTDLPDVFDLICEKLRNREQFSFARYGDGEWNAIYGKQGANCDGHEYFPDMGKRLREIVESKPKYMMGLQPLTVASERIVQIQKDFPGIDWIDADSIHNASIDGRTEELFNVIRPQDSLIIGPRHMSDEFTTDFILIQSINCWLEVESTIHKIHSWIMGKQRPVIFLCASMMSEVLIDEFHQEATLIDLGSVLDPYCGVKSRRYHHKLAI